MGGLGGSEGAEFDGPLGVLGGGFQWFHEDATTSLDLQLFPRSHTRLGDGILLDHRPSQVGSRAQKPWCGK